MTAFHRSLVAILAIAVLGVSSPALAQDTSDAPAAGSNAGEIAEARARYERGIKLYEDGAFDAARSEFERAYSLVPSWKLLYNIGLVYEQLSNFVGAMHKFKQYLQEGGDKIPPERRQEVEAELQKLQPRIAIVTINTNVRDANVTVDDVPVGKSPLAEPVEVNPGQRRISATHPGRLPATKVIDVAGSDRVTITLDLPPAPTKTVVVGTPTRRVPWVGWIATGVLAIGAGITGYAALDSSAKLSNVRDAPGADPDDLDHRASQVKTLSIIADSLTAAAVIAGGISLYYTIKWGRETPTQDTGTKEAAKSSPPPARTISAGFTLGGAALRGTF